MEDISTSEDQIDMNQTYAASLESDKFTADHQKPPDTGDNTDDDDDDDEDEIFRPSDVNVEDDVEMVSSAITANNEYSGIDVGLTADTPLSPSSSYDVLPTVPSSRMEQRHSSLPSSGDEEDPMSQVVDAVESQDEGPPEKMVTSVRPGDVGNLTDADELTVVFLARMLCSEFLLTGYRCGLFTDRQVRISVKMLALSCVGCLVDLYPQLAVTNLHKTSSEPGNS